MTVLARAWCESCGTSGPVLDARFDSERMVGSWTCPACGERTVVPIGPDTALLYRLVYMPDDATERLVAGFVAEVETATADGAKETWDAD